MSVPTKIPTKDRDTNRQVDVIIGEHLRPQSLTTTQINSLSNKDIMIVYDKTLGVLKFWNGSSWKTITST